MKEKLGRDDSRSAERVDSESLKEAGHPGVKRERAIRTGRSVWRTPKGSGGTVGTTSSSG